MVIVYGIKNCDTVKKALAWLKQHAIAYEFHDYKSEGITAEKLNRWSAQTGWEKLVNKKGTTWKQLPPEVQAQVVSSESAIALMREKPVSSKGL